MEDHDEENDEEDNEEGSSRKKKKKTASRKGKERAIMIPEVQRYRSYEEPDEMPN